MQPDYFHQQSNRLTYRKLQEEDIPSWMEFFVNNDRLHFLGVDLQKSKETLAEEWIHTQLYRYKHQGLGHLAVERKEDGAFIGVGGIIPRLLHENQECEIAYSLKPSYWGNGYATEIALHFQAYGLRYLPVKRLISIIDVDNVASANVARKNGMNVLFQTDYLGMQVDVFGIANPSFHLSPNVS